MTTDSTIVTDRIVEVAGGGIRLLESGSGQPLVLLHHSTGNSGWLPLHARLAESFAVMVPDLPGYGQSMRPAWAREPRDIAILLHQLLDSEGLDQIVLVGAGFGGFIAAEMASMNQGRLSSLVLVGAAGLRPNQGEILDQMMITHRDYVGAGFVDEQSFQRHIGADISAEIDELWDFSREMTARIAWKPYMFSLRLAPLLAEVRTPALLVWGAADRVIPLDCAHQYEAALANARLEVIEGAGHNVDLEEPEQLTRLILRHVNVT